MERYRTIASLSLVPAAETLGFFASNYPFGPICLGDAGAYTLTTRILAPFVIAPQIVGVVLWAQNRAVFLTEVIFLVLFFGSFILVLSAVRNNRRQLACKGSLVAPCSLKQGT